MSQSSVTAAINADLLKWAKGALAPWQHEAFRRILSKGGLTEQDYTDVVQRAQYDLQLATPPQPLPSVELTAADLPSAPASPTKVILKALKGLEGVNALKGGQELTFGKQLTLIYGDNASGKSGYARVVKKVVRCAAAAVEPILPDVFTASGSSPSAKATVDLEVGGTSKTVNWQDGQASPEEMRQFAVFDSKCARALLTSENEVSFVPSVLDALKVLSAVTDQIKQRILTAAQQAAPPVPASYQFMVEDKTSVGKALGSITVQTDPKAISSLAQWGSREVGELGAKEAELKRLQEVSPRVLRERLSRESRDLTTLKTSLDQVRAALSSEKVALLKEQVDELAKQSEAFRAAAGLAVGESKLQGIGSDAWRALIEAAASFSTTEAYKGKPFPAASQGDLCVLCQQPLGDEAVARLKRFWAFLQADAATKRDAAQRAVLGSVRAMQVVPPTLPDAVAPLAAEFEEKNPTLWTAVGRFFEAARVRLSAIQHAVKQNSWDTVPELDGEVADSCNFLLKANKEALGAVPDETQALAKIKALSSERDELAARKRLSENVQSVLGHLAALKKSQRLRAAGNQISTHSITSKARQLYTTHVTASFKKEVVERVRTLGLRRARCALAEKPEKGKVLQSIALDGVKFTAAPEAVLSEGERTGIALSYFLADLGSPENTSGIIFDDPVTSLDHRIRDGVVKVLVDEAKARQVIVFTHDLAFFCEMRSRAVFEKVDTVCCHVESFSSATGVVQGEVPWDAMPIKDRTGKLQTHILDAKKADGAGNADAYRQQVARFYGRLRATWERAVEELLFNQVVTRYERGVQTMRLRGVAVDKDAVTKVFAAMTRCSDIVDAHDHAVAASVPIPSPADMETDLTALSVFVKEQREKIKTAEKENDHLRG